MQDTTGLLDRIKHHNKLPITVNENCSVPLPNDVLQQLFQPHRLSFYYFVFMYQGSTTCSVDLEEISVSDGQLVFGLPDQIFNNVLHNPDDQHYALAFDENTLAQLPHSYPFLVNPFNSNKITFDAAARERVKGVVATLFQLLHAPGMQRNAAIILAYLNTLLTELNSAYFEQHNSEDTFSNPKLSKYVAFKLAVETHLTEQHDVHTIAEKLAMTTSTLYGIVKEFSGVSPKEWMTNRLILEAQRKLRYSQLSAKELAYELGFSDPNYFSRLFKKSTGKSVSEFLADLRDLSSKKND